MQSIYIRPATVEDAADLSAFAARVFIETFAAENRPEDLAAYLRLAFSPEIQANEIADPAARVLLALSSGAPDEWGSTLTGYAHVGQSEAPPEVDGPEPLELKRFYVASAWQGRGLAQALMRAVVRSAQERRARSLWLGVWERNARAIAFYRKQGFREVGSHVFMLGSDAQTDLLMQLPLDAAPKD